MHGSKFLLAMDKAVAPEGLLLGWAYSIAAINRLTQCVMACRQHIVFALRQQRRRVA